MNSRLSDLTCRNLKFRSISHPNYPLTPILGLSGKHGGQFLHDVLMESISRSSVVRPCVKDFPKDNVLYTFYIISPFKDYIIQAQWLKNHACRSPYCKFCSNSLGTFSRVAQRFSVASSLVKYGRYYFGDRFSSSFGRHILSIGEGHYKTSVSLYLLVSSRGSLGNANARNISALQRPNNDVLILKCSSRDPEGKNLSPSLLYRLPMSKSVLTHLGSYAEKGQHKNTAQLLRTKRTAITVKEQADAIFQCLFI